MRMITDFEQMRELFLTPISRLGEKISDCTYLLRKDGSLTFAQGYYHPVGYVSGKITYYPHPDGWVDIFGRPYECMHKKYIDGTMYSYTNPQQITKHLEIFPELRERAKPAPVIKNNLLFPRDEFEGFFRPRHARDLCMRLYPKVRKGIEAACELLEVPVETTGLTGSLQYGRLEKHDDDTDIIFFGSVEENYRLMQRITRFVRENPSRHVHEFGKFWPLRFYYGGILVCPFFAYSKEDEIPLRNGRITVLSPRSTLTGVIADIRHSIYMPLVFPVDDARIDGRPREDFTLILSDSYVRGEFSAGTRITAEGELVRVDTGERVYDALIVANNWEVKTVES